jgi:hypothetical protein
MSRTQAVLLVLACLAAAAWAARRAGPVLSADVKPTRQAASAVLAPLPSHGILVQADRLRTHVASPPPFRPPVRNPFRFNEPPPPPAPARTNGGAAISTTAAAVERAERPEMQLVGIAEDRLPDGAVRRTAIVSAMTQLFFAKEGERVLGRYEVVRITPDAAQLKDPDGQTFTLALK